MSRLLILSLLTFSLAQVFPTTSMPVTFEEKLYLKNFLLQNGMEVENNNSNNPNDCFDLYLPQLQAAANQWSANYADCYNNADNRRNNFIEQLKSDHVSINESSTQVCNYIKICQNMTNELDYFKCFGNLSQNVITIIYVISNNATDDALLLSEQLEGVDTELYSCTNDTQRTYVEKTALIFDALDNCLTNGLDESTKSTVEANEMLELKKMTIGIDGYDDDDDRIIISGNDMSNIRSDEIGTLSNNYISTSNVHEATTIGADDATIISVNVSVVDTTAFSGVTISILGNGDTKIIDGEDETTNGKEITTISVDDVTAIIGNITTISVDDTTTIDVDNNSTLNGNDDATATTIDNSMTVPTDYTSTLNDDNGSTVSTDDTSDLSSNNFTTTIKHTTIPIMSV